VRMLTKRARRMRGVGVRMRRVRRESNYFWEGRKTAIKEAVVN